MLRINRSAELNYVEAEAVNFLMFIYKKNLEENHGMDLVTRPIYWDGDLGYSTVLRKMVRITTFVILSQLAHVVSCKWCGKSDRSI